MKNKLFSALAAAFGTNPNSTSNLSPADTTQNRARHYHAHQTPRTDRFALEPRVMFDAAGLASVTTENSLNLQIDRSLVEARSDVSDLAFGADVRGDAQASRSLVVIDWRVQNTNQLMQAADSSVDFLVIGADQNGLQMIAQALAEKPNGAYGSISVLAHGLGSGRMQLGNGVLSTDSMQLSASELSSIGQALGGARDILLFACDLAADRNGLDFLSAFAQATGADVAASSNTTAGLARGGDWNLEASVGVIESKLNIDRSALANYDGVLAGAPQVTLSGGGNVLIGGNFSVTALFDNVGPDAGYAPYIDVFVPRQGVDGGASPDGLRINSATFLGQTVAPTTIVLSAANISSGTVAHPFYRDSSGSNLVSIPTGFVAGDQLLVYQLPFGSFTAAQPAAALVLSGTVSNLADVGTPLNLAARGGFALGNTPLNDPTTDPSFFSAATTLAVNPQLYVLTTTYIGPENETATGINFPRAYRIDVDIAEGQTLSNLDLSSILSPGMQFAPISGTPTAVSGVTIGAAPAGGWTNVNGVLISGSGSSLATPSLVTPGGTVTREINSAVGTSAAIDASMVVQFYVPKVDGAGVEILDPISGDDRLLTVGTNLAATWANPIDPRDATTPVSTTVAVAHILEAQSNAIQKLRTITSDVGATGISPGDLLRYDMALQISDYFGIGGNPTGTDLLVRDTLSDGLEFLDSATVPAATNPTLSVTRDGVTSNYALVRGTNYVVTDLPDGRQTIVFNLRSALPSAGNGQLLLGDLFAGDSTRQGGTTASISFNARVLDAYRFGPADDNGDPVTGSGANGLNEGDRVVNNAVFSGTVLNSALNPTLAGLLSESDDTRVTDRIAVSQVEIAAIRLNGSTVPGQIAVTPGDTVTYCLSYVVPTGDFENFSLSAFIPLPLFLVTDPDGDGTPSALTAQGGAFTNNPTVGSFSARATGGNGLGLSQPVTVTADGQSNSLSFALGDRGDTTNTPLTIEICFTLRSTDIPFADNLLQTAQASSAGTNTASNPQASNAIGSVVIATPQLSIFKGVVGENVNEANSTFDPSFSGGNPTTLVRQAGDASANPLLGTLTAANVRSSLDTNISNVDAGDTVRFGLAIVNEGSSVRGAFDVTITDTLPTNIDPASLSNLRVVDGNGNPVAFTGSLATLFTTGIQLTDASVNSGSIGAGSTAGVATTNGSNVVFITYDAVVLSTAPIASSASSNASVTRYAGQDAGTNYAVPVLSNAASLSTPTPLIDKVIVGTDRAFTAGNDVVIGEIVTYRVTITVPEGSLANASFLDTLDSNLSFVSLDSMTLSSGLTFAPALPGFNTATVSDVGGGVKNQVSFNFGNIQNNNVNNAATETITLEYRVVVSDVVGNQQGVRQNNAASLTSSTTTINAQAPDVIVVEPNVTITNTPNVTTIDSGDVVTYTLVIASNGSAPAFEVNLADVIPVGTTYVASSLSQTGGPAATTALSESGGSISGSWSQLSVGDTVTITYQVRVNSGVQLGQTLDHNANIDWSSLPGTNNNDLSPLAGANDTERTGSGGVNDYAASDSAPVSVIIQTPVLTLVNTSEGTSSGANVVPGEIVRYRMVVQLPESNAPNFQLAPTLPAGIRLINDGTATIALVSDSGITSSTISGAGLNINGGGLTAADIAGVAPVTVIPTSAIVDASGNPIASGYLASGSSPIFSLGTLQNNDTDGDREFVVIEFNAVVDNSAATANGVTRDVSFAVNSNGVQRGVSNIVTITEQEPSITNIDKRVVGVSGNTVTYEVTFSNTGTATAHDVRLTDPFTGAVNTTFGGAASVTGLPGGATNASNAVGLDVLIPTLAPGASVTLRYTALVTDMTLAVPPRDAQVVYTSLNETDGKVLTVTTATGTATSTSNGERTGDPINDYGLASNTYRDTDPAGLGVISGKLWDDTSTYNQSPDGTEPGLTARTVTLLWAGLNGTFGDADDQTFTTTTSSTAGAEGTYSFGAAPLGNYRISTGTSFTDPTVGPVRVYTDAGGGVGTDGIINVTLTDGQSRTNQNFGFVEINDAPNIAAPTGPINVNEDAPLSFTGVNAITVADVDAGTTSNNQVTLSVSNGNLSIATTPGVVITNNASATVTLVGSIADINTALASLTYQGVLNFAGSDTLVVRIDDRGNTGDANGNNIPNEIAGDNLFATTNVSLFVVQQPDPPTATTSTRSAGEDTTITGNTLTPTAAQILAGDVADTDPDLVYGDNIRVQGIAAGNVSGPLNTVLTTAVAGAYGTLIIDASGAYTYTPGPAANALKLGQSATDTFTYTIVDSTSRTSTAQIIINLTGVNDPVAALPDTRSMSEDELVINGNAVLGASGVGGQPGDVADPDPDGDVVSVQGVVAGPSATPVTGGLGSSIVGTWGSLILNSDGTYSYTPDQALVQPIQAGTTVTDVFTYTVRDPAGTTATTTITISIVGSNDAINAFPDERVIPEPNPTAVAAVTGQAITPSAAQIALGDRGDTSIDSYPLTVVGVRAGVQTGTLNGGQATSVLGQYGSLTLNVNGSYSYLPNANAQTIAQGQTATDVFTYSITNGQGDFATTRLTIRLVGENDPISALPDRDQIASTAIAPVTGNVVTGVAPAGSVAQLQADPDVDVNDIKTIVGLAAGVQAGNLTGQVGQAVLGTYGSVVLTANGQYSYTVNTTSPAVLALRAGETLSDVFSYTVSDGKGGFATTTLTIVTTGANEPPAGADKTFTISEDLVAEAGAPLTFAAADFGFIDPDRSDVLTGFKVDSLPSSGSLTLNGVPVTVGQTISVDQLPLLRYTPALNANRDTLNNVHPFFDFRVIDRDGLTDPIANRFTIVITPTNDLPIAPSITRTIDSDAILTLPSSQVIGMGRPSDVDEPLQTLRVTVDAVPNAQNEGRFFRPDGSEVLAGSSLSLADLQSLRFVPSPSLAGTPDAAGLLPAGRLAYTVNDGAGGSASGNININVRTISPAPPPATTSIAPAVPTLLAIATAGSNIPIIEGAGAAINAFSNRAGGEVGPNLISNQIQAMRNSPLFSANANRTDLSSDGFFQGDRWDSLFGDERIGPTLEGSQPVEMPKPEPVVVAPADNTKARAVKAQAVEDCAPEAAPKIKVKPKQVKRSIHTDLLGPKENKFSEQVKAAKKRFALPKSVAPPAPPKC
jgi:large repetitive protein